MRMISSGELTLKIMKEASWYNQWLFSFVRGYCGGEILEIGAGIGNFTELLSEKGNVTAIDIDPKYLRMFKKNKTKNVVAGFGDIEKNKYFFKDKKFDTIICLNVLEHIENHLIALKNMHSLLKKNGKLILLVPAHRLLFSEFDKTIGHFRRYTRSEVLKLMHSVKFRNVETRYLNWVSAIGWFLTLRLTKNKNMPPDDVRIFNIIGRFLLWPERYFHIPFGLSVLSIVKK